MPLLTRSTVDDSVESEILDELEVLDMLDERDMDDAYDASVSNGCGTLKCKLDIPSPTLMT